MPKEKKPKEKKPKKVKPPKEKKAKKGKGEKQEKSAKGKKKPILLIIPILILAVVAVVFFVKGRGGDGETDGDGTDVTDTRPVLPAEYTFDGTTIPGLMPGEEERDVRARLAKTITYTYDRLKAPGSAASLYTDQLSSSGFSVVDAEFVRTTERPDYAAPEGSLLMAKNKPKSETPEGENSTPEGENSTAEEDEEAQAPKVITVGLSWREDLCIVTVDEALGQVTSPPPEESAGMSTMTISEAADYVNSLPPSVLGLSGESMEYYHVYARDGAVFVNGQPCMKIDVYDDHNPQQANAIAGSYLITNDGLHLYRLDETTKTVQELDVG